ncbi:MAG: DMT family transporter [Thermoguttaceae bacterium]
MFDRYPGELAAIGTAVFWTLSSIFFTSAGRRVGALAVSFFRMVIACALLMACAPLVGSQPVPTDAGLRTWILLGISGFLGFFLCDICLYKAMILIGPRLTLLVFSLLPPMTTIGSLAIGETITFRQWLGMCITLAGIVWVVLERPDGEDGVGPNAPGPPESYPWPTGPIPHSVARRRGLALALFATAMSAIGMVFSRDVMQVYKDVTGATLIRVLGALPGYIVLLTVFRRWPAMLCTIRNRSAAILLLAGSLIGSFAGSFLNMLALRYSSAGVVTTITATMPVLILPLTILVYHERVSPRAVGGALLAVAGVALLVLRSTT